MAHQGKGEAEDDMDGSNKDRFEKVQPFGGDLANDRLEWQNRIHVGKPQHSCNKVLMTMVMILNTATHTQETRLAFGAASILRL